MLKKNEKQKFTGTVGTVRNELSCQGELGTRETIHGWRGRHVSQRVWAGAEESPAGLPLGGIHAGLSARRVRRRNQR